MIGRIARVMTILVNRFLPDPLIFAILLTFVLFGCAIVLTPNGPIDLIKMWGDGFWNLMTFTMQMALIVVTGHALASSQPVRRLLKTCASLAKTPPQAVMLVTFFSAIACALNWGFGLIVGAMFAREIAKRLTHTDYRLLIASAYIGFMTWHGGISGSIPLMAATPGNPMQKYMSDPNLLIPVTNTIFSPYNLFITIALIVLLPFLTRLMVPQEKDVVSIDPALLQDEPNFQRKLPPNATPAERMGESVIIGGIMSLIGVVYLIQYFAHTGFNLTINHVNLIFLVLGLILHRAPMAYMRAATAATTGTAGILVQFPFYAGIQLLMVKSGVGTMLSEFFVRISTKDTFYIWTYLSSGLVNLMIPSGGGHLVVQGPYVLPAAEALHCDLGKAVMAICYGDEWMNMAQPFWAMPALAVAGLGVRDIMGFCITALIFTVPIYLIGLWFF